MQVNKNMMIYEVYVLPCVINRLLNPATATAPKKHKPLPSPSTPASHQLPQLPQHQCHISFDGLSFAFLSASGFTSISVDISSKMKYQSDPGRLLCWLRLRFLVQLQALPRYLLQGLQMYFEEGSYPFIMECMRKGAMKRAWRIVTLNRPVGCRRICRCSDCRI
jgi:hypothetical protein